MSTGLEQITIVVNAFLSLLWEYFPGFKDKLESWLPIYRFLFVVGCNIVFSIVIYVYENGTLFTWEGLGEQLWLILIAFISGQAAHMLDKFQVKLRAQK